MDIDLFLFGSAFTGTWKLQKGMVVVLLNPQIYKKKDGTGFNLRMTENKTPLTRQQQLSTPTEIEGGESVLEVGFAKDWAGCEALRADGTICGDWVDTRHTKICAYHVDHQLQRAGTKRHEYAVGYRPPPQPPLLTYILDPAHLPQKKKKNDEIPLHPENQPTRTTNQNPNLLNSLPL